MRIFFTLAFLFFASSQIFSQEVEFKKGVVLIDGAAALKYEGSDLKGSYSFSDMKGNEVIFIRIDKSPKVDLYWTMVFVKEKKTMTTKYSIPNKKTLIQKLVKEHVLENGAIVPDKLESFFLKYDEHIQ